jgi:hypothetical protein
MDFCEHEENLYLAASACKSGEEKHRLDMALYEIDKEDSYGLLPGEALLSAKTYHAIRELISFPSDTVIVDCGCCTALQQVFFNDCYKYIGIDIRPSFIKISDNAEFIHGDILEVLPNMVFEEGKRYIGISVLCGSVWSNIGKVIKEKFDKVVIV